LLMIFLPREVGSFLLGWAKPVPVNLNNLRNPKLDDVLITMAGPWMNLLLAVVCVGGIKIGIIADSFGVVEFCHRAAYMNLGLFFFNLLPIPPLDGSRIMRVVVGMSHETYAQLSQYSYFVIIALIQWTPVPDWIGFLCRGTYSIISSWFGMR
ncbi:MAG: site-2 protease family protein, partial [Verrucomicrobiota bacterium]